MFLKIPVCEIFWTKINLMSTYDIQMPVINYTQHMACRHGEFTVIDKWFAKGTYFLRHRAREREKKNYFIRNNKPTNTQGNTYEGEKELVRQAQGGNNAKTFIRSTPTPRECIYIHKYILVHSMYRAAQNEISVYWLKFKC